MNLSHLRRKMDRLLQEASHASRQAREEKEVLVSCLEGVQEALEAQKSLQEIAEEVQTVAHRRVADVVSRCLRAVFGESTYQFRIVFERKRGKTEASLLFMREGREIDPTSGAGGGVLDVAAFALRIASLCLSRPAKRRLLVLDEPFKWLSRNHLPEARRLVQSLSEELGVQFLIVTHLKALEIGSVINLEEEE